MIRFVAAALILSAPGQAMAQAMDHSMHGMAPPSVPAAAAQPGEAVPPAAAEPVGTDLQPGSAPAPAPPADRYNDRFWPAEAMAQSRDLLHREHGGMNLSLVMVDILELQPRRGADAFRWDAEGWFGGDINRLMITTEGEGQTRGGVGDAEVQVLYGRALDAYWNLRGGVRQDLGAGVRRTYATIGVEGLAPYWFELEGSAFLSDQGEVLGRIEAYYDQRITQRLVLQPRLEVDFAAQDSPATRTGSGLSEVALDLRLRYEIRREFAPYVGLSWQRRLSSSGDYAAADGEDRGGVRLALGVRAWF